MEVIARVAALAAFLLWLAVAIGPVVLFIRHHSLRDHAHRLDAERNGRTWHAPDAAENAKRWVIGLVLLGAFGALAFGALGDPQKLAAIAYSRVSGQRF